MRELAGFQQASISHQPSNADLLLRGGSQLMRGVRSVRSMGNLLSRGGTPPRPLSRGGSGSTANGGGSAAATPGVTPPGLSPQVSPRRTDAGTPADAKVAPAAPGRSSSSPATG